MKKLASLFLTFFLGFSLHSFAQSPSPSPLPLDPQLTTQEKSLSFQSLDHDIEGCPANSHCSRSQGAKRLKWTKLLQRLEKETAQYAVKEIETFRQQEGIPFGVWATTDSLKNEQIISWNSGCPHHNKEIEKVLQAELMIKAIDQEDNEQFIWHKLWIEDEKQMISSYKIPRGSSPTHIIEDKLYFNATELGIYYGMLLSQQGQMEIINSKTNVPLPHETSCPKNLTTLKQQMLKDKKIFQDYYCRAIWDATKKSYRVMMLGWSC